MMPIQEIVEKLNQALTNVDFNKDEVENLLVLLTEHQQVKVKILDFEYYNEERLEYAKNEKSKEVKFQNFEQAASWRHREKKILKYIELRKEFNIKKSGFHFEEEFLFFFYLGTEKNDKQLKEIIINKFKI